MNDILIRPALPADLPTLHPIIERAYRTDAGWTHEARVVTGPRTDLPTLAAVLESASERLLVAVEGDRPLGCVQVTGRGGGTAYLGLLAVDPARQADGLGRRLIAAAEACAVRDFGARRIEMTVVSGRAELIGYYARRGYAPTGEERPFPKPDHPWLRMAVLARQLS